MSAKLSTGRRSQPLVTGPFKRVESMVRRAGGHPSQPLRPIGRMPVILAFRGVDADYCTVRPIFDASARMQCRSTSASSRRAFAQPVPD